eukprot:494047_1
MDLDTEANAGCINSSPRCVPLLEQSLNALPMEDDMDFPEIVKEESNEVIASHTRNKILFWLKWFGFRHSPPIVIIIVMGVLIINLTVNALTVKNSEYCLYLNMCVLSFQAESVVLYFFAFYSVTKLFIEKVVTQLAHIDLRNPKYTEILDDEVQNQTDNRSEVLISSLKFNKIKSVHKKTSVRIYERYKSQTKQTGSQIFINEALKCLSIIFPSYLTGYFIFFSADNSSRGWHIYVYVSNILDIIRYAPQILHIALARSYFQTFPVELQRLRNELCVIKRKEDLNEQDYENDKCTLKVTHKTFIEMCERVVRPYRRLSSQLSEWIVVYFVCNAVGFTFFLLTLISALLNKDCQYNEIGLYYFHYLVELWTFFAGWVFLVLPYCNNQSILTSFFNDVKTMGNISAIEKCAIDRYIDSYLEKSPFSIYSVKPSYGRFMNLLYIVFATITLDIVSKVYDIDVI